MCKHTPHLPPASSLVLTSHLIHQGTSKPSCFSCLLMGVPSLLSACSPSWPEPAGTTRPCSLATPPLGPFSHCPILPPRNQTSWSLLPALPGVPQGSVARALSLLTSARPALTTPPRVNTPLPCLCDSLWCPLSAFATFSCAVWSTGVLLFILCLCLVNSWCLVYYFVNRWMKEKLKICKVRSKSPLPDTYDDPS